MFGTASMPGLPRVQRSRLGLVVPSLQQGGGVPSVARFVKDAAERSGEWQVVPVSLCQSSNDSESVSLLNPTSWLRGPVVGCRRWLDCDVAHVGARFGEIEFQRYRRRTALTEALAECDVIQVVCGSPAWANSVLGLGKPVALQVATRAIVERRQRDASPSSIAGWWRKGMTRITDRLDDRAMRHVDAIQVENPWMLEYARAINAHRSDVDIRYAPPGVDGQLFEPLTQRDLTKDPYILCVGRLDDPRKRIGLLLEVYARLPSSVRDRVRLVLAGASGPPEAFWTRADALGLRQRIQYVKRPERDALVALYQHASVFVLSSDEEGFGVVITEAMACGVPVVSTRSGGPDGIIADGVDGYLVPLDTADLMAQRLQVLLEDSGANLQMGVHARRTVEMRYDERVAGQVFVDMWQRLLAKPSCRAAATWQLDKFRSDDGQGH